VRLDSDHFEFVVSRAAMVCDGTIEAGQLAELEALVQRDNAARLLLVEYLDQHAALKATAYHDAYGRPWELVDSVLEETRSGEADDAALLEEVLEQESRAAARRAAQRAMLAARRQAEEAERRRAFVTMMHDVTVTPVRHIVIPRAMVYGTMAALLALVVYLIARPNPVAAPPANDPNLAAVDVPPLVATLERTFDAQWENPALPTQAGTRLRASSLRLKQGFAEIQFDSGATVILQAPVELELVSRDRARLLRGRLVGHVPTEARGFTVAAPNAAVIDLGTEFGVRVDNNGDTHVLIYEGAVALATGDGTTPSTAQSFTAGSAVRVDPTGVVTPVQPDPLAFVRRDELNAHVMARQGSAYHRWLAYSYELRRRDDLIAYYPFDAESRSQDRLLNRAGITADRLHGTLGDLTDEATRPSWTNGRFAEKAALFYAPRSEPQRVIVPHDPVFSTAQQLTIAYWIRLADMDDAPRTIISKRGSDVEFQSAVYPSTHSIQFATGPTPRGAPDGVYESQPIAPSRDWQLIVVTFDGRTARFYRNGELVDVQTLAYPLVHTTADLWIGTANHYEAYPEEQNPSKFAFSGWIDELAIFRSVLDVETIRTLYEAGRPQ